jgi:hypothetical protein
MQAQDARRNAQETALNMIGLHGPRPGGRDGARGGDAPAGRRGGA